MKSHDLYLELAAAAIDFPLTGAERVRLDEHLASCAACVRSITGLHEDALAMESLAPVVLPERREAEILGAILHPGDATHTMRLIVVTALMALLLLGTLIAGSEIIRRNDENKLVVVPPVPPATIAPDASAAPAETGPITPVGDLVWEQVGSVPDGVGGLFAVSGGYVTYVDPGYPTGPSARFSTDGRTWSEPVPLAAQHLNCPGWGPDGDDNAPDGEIRGGISNGREVVLFGREQLFTDEACANPGASYRMMTWVTSDGRTWERSEGFGDPGSEATGAWPTADGWQVAGGSGIWASTDGIRWSPAGMEAGAPDGVGPPAAAAGSTVVGVPQSPEEDTSLGLSVWREGSWKPVALPEECPQPVELVVAPASWEGARWLISGGTTVCTSADLELWTAASLEAPYPSDVAAIVRTRYGFVGSSFCADMTCPSPPPYWQWVSPDGVTWTPVTSPVGAAAIADGPAGVLAVDGEGGMWRLTDTGSVTTPSPPTSTPAATPAPVAPSKASWKALGPIETGRSGEILGVRMIGDGFAAWGTYGDDGDPLFATWYSRDGLEWQRTDQAQIVVPCEGWTARPDLESIYAWPSDGRTTAIIATQLLPGVCDRSALVALSTTDGRTWTRSDPFLEGAGWVEHAWATPDGWEILVREPNENVTIWRSGDLERWDRVGSPQHSVGAHGDFWATGSSVVDERLGVVIERNDMDETRDTLVSSTAGVDWQERLVLPDGFDVQEIVPPLEPGRPWLVTIESGSPEEARVLVSTDLAQWTSTTLDKPGLRYPIATGSGWAGIALWPGRDTGCGNDCRAPRPTLLGSADGVEWADLGTPGPVEDGAALFADGRGGILAAVTPGGDDNVVPGRLTIK